MFLNLSYIMKTFVSAVLRGVITAQRFYLGDYFVEVRVDDKHYLSLI